MSAGMSAVVTVVVGVFAVLAADASEAWGAAFLGFVAGGCFVTFVNEVWP